MTGRLAETLQLTQRKEAPGADDEPGGAPAGTCADAAADALMADTGAASAAPDAGAEMQTGESAASIH